MQYLLYVLTGERCELLRLMIEGKGHDKRSVGRCQNSWLKDVRRWFDRSPAEISRAVVSKATIAVWNANLREETVS